MEKINNITIEKIPVMEDDKRHPKGYKLFPNYHYFNVFLLAITQGGKTTCLFNILKQCIGKETNLYFFSSTIFDSDYKAMIKFFKKKGINVYAYPSLYDGKGKDKTNILNEFMQDYAESHTDESDDEDEKENEEDEEEQLTLIDNFKPPSYLFQPEEDTKEAKINKKRKSKFVEPENIFVFDDLASELGDPIVEEFLFKSRHYKSINIISNQHLNTLSTGARGQVKYWLLFKGLNSMKLKEVYKSMDLSLDYDIFETIYKYVIALKKYNFLYVSKTNEFRINFNIRIDPIVLYKYLLSKNKI